VKQVFRIAAMLALGLAATSASAQSPKEPRREELFKMIDAYVVSNLQESLGLTDEQFVKVLPLIKRLQSDRRSFVLRRSQALNEMRRLLESGRATDARIAELMKDLKTIEAEEPTLLRRNSDSLDAELTPLQQAKLRLLENRVEQRLREVMSRVRGDANPRPLRRALPASPEPEP
jgi:Spy/CpxP family protein refolding chaperone